MQWHAVRFMADDRKARVACKECARLMWLPPSKVATYQRCSPACNAAWRARRKAARLRTCETCAGTFTARVVQIRNGGGRFCSQRCNRAFREAGNTAAGRQRSVATRRRNMDAGVLVWPRGPEHHSWRGGEEAARERNRPRDRELLRRYRAANPDKVREFTQRRAGRKIGRLARGTIPRIGQAQRWRCAVCSVSISDGYHVDHVMPLALGGEHVGRNIQLLCQPCNLTKNAKDPIDFMRSLGRLL